MSKFPQVMFLNIFNFTIKPNGIKWRCTTSIQEAIHVHVCQQKVAKQKGITSINFYMSHEIKKNESSWMSEKGFSFKHYMFMLLAKVTIFIQVIVSNSFGNLARICTRTYNMVRPNCFCFYVHVSQLTWIIVD